MRGIALVVIRDARARLLYDEVYYSARTLYHLWRRELVGVIFRAELYPQGNGVGQTVARWLHNDVFASRDDNDDLHIRFALQPGALALQPG